jgi:hypothetical protein
MGGQPLVPGEKLKPPEYTSKLFGRRWKVSVLVPKTDVPTSEDPDYTAYVVSNSDYENKTLRVTFDIQKKWTVPNISEICIYNLNSRDEKILFKNGTIVQVEAGYVNGHYGLIYEGDVFQPMWERENNVTFKLTLRCIDVMRLLSPDNHVAMSAALMTQQETVLKMAEASRVSFTPKISKTMVSTRPTRTKVLFDNPFHYLRKWCQQNGTMVGSEDGVVYLSRPQDTNEDFDSGGNALVLSPGKGGIIGVPQQTQDGVNFTCLLNPLIGIFKNPFLIKIDNSFIRQTAVQYGDKGFSMLDQDGMYKVIGVNHVGDTRGKDWYSHVIGVNQSMEGVGSVLFSTMEHIANN